MSGTSKSDKQLNTSEPTPSNLTVLLSATKIQQRKENENHKQSPNQSPQHSSRQSPKASPTQSHIKQIEQPQTSDMSENTKLGVSPVTSSSKQNPQRQIKEVLVSNVPSAMSDSRTHSIVELSPGEGEESSAQQQSIIEAIKPEKNIFDNWSSFYLSIWPNIKNKADVLIALYHFLLINNNYTCLGLGDDKTLSENEHSYSSLPPGWNYFSKYALRYVYRNCGVYLLQAHVFDSCLIINFLNSGSKEVTNLAFYPDKLVRGRDGGRIKQLIPKADEVIKNMKNSFCSILCKDPDGLSANLEMRRGTDPSTWVGIQNSYPSVRTEAFSELDDMRC